MRASTTRRAAIAALSAVLTAAVLVSRPEAHKPITSRYTYNADIYPIVRKRCAACHVDRGIAPMSLLAYKDALPWAESIRQELIGESMPPFYADPTGPAVKGPTPMSAAEVDTLVTWATGGTPEGESPLAAAAAPPPPEWSAGPPDATFTPAAPYTVPASAQEETHDFSFETSYSGPRWVAGADLRPGDPSIVRDARLSIGDQVVLAWVPGERAVMAPGDAGFLLAPGDRLVLRVHYRKSWQDERTAKPDRSTLGLYFAREPRIPIRSIAGGSTAAAAVSAIAVRPRLDRPYGSVVVQAVCPRSDPIALLKLLAPRPGWPRRYWLEHPIAIPAGCRVETATTPAALGPDEVVKPSASPLGVAVDVIPGSDR
ncbi:MAG TPA: hypothetical protein VL309_07060 [Vicinamibacterales bacterium]|jgi:hypothetical protein|nr:hypothetical protein [Vicinamibacterales bacterium]